MSLRRLLTSILTCAALAAAPAAAHAGVDRIGVDRVTSATDYEVVVFEMDACTICGVFRRDIAPGYIASKRNETAPMRFQVADSLTPHPGLQAPLSMLPTAVVLKNGREIARVEGYTGPEMFFQIMGRVFSTLPR